MVHSWLKKTENGTLGETMDHGHGGDGLSIHTDNSGDHGEMFVTVFGLADPIIAFRKSAGHFQIANHDFTLIPLFKLVKFIIVILKIKYFELWHICFRLHSFYDFLESEIFQFLRLFFQEPLSSIHF